MPVGCWLDHLIIRKSALRLAIEAARSKGAAEIAHFLQAILDRPHQDEHLVALQDMGGDDFFRVSLMQAGLVSDDGDDCVDFYSPYTGCPRATWLEEAQIRNIPGPLSEKTLPRWTAYRLIGDSSVEVILEANGGQETFQPDSFPAAAVPVDPSLWSNDTWALVPETDTRLSKWRLQQGN